MIKFLLTLYLLYGVGCFLLLVWMFLTGLDKQSAWFLPIVVIWWLINTLFKKVK